MTISVNKIFNPFQNDHIIMIALKSQYRLNFNIFKRKQDLYLKNVSISTLQLYNIKYNKIQRVSVLAVLYLATRSTA